MIPPKDSRDPDWQGPLSKTKLRQMDLYFYECLQAATCEDDIFVMTESPEWKDYLIQVEHDLPYLVDGGEDCILTLLDKKKAELV